MRRFLLTAATAATALVSAACGDSTGLGSNPAGSYELISVNGQSLPYNDGSVIFCGGVLDLDNDGTFVDLIQLRDSGSPLCETFEDTGVWEQDGNEIILDYDGNIPTAFAIRRSNSRLTVESSGYTLEYRRF
jgi:hypothetical protein